MQRVTIAANIAIPIVGLGTWKAQSEELDKAVEVAINAGYRHFDTAFNYNTEGPLGSALKRLIESGVVKREDLFITTKLPVFGNRAKDVEHYIKMSLAKLQMDYVDLYLIHMPFAFNADKNGLQPEKREDGSMSLDMASKPEETWKAMEDQVRAGRAKCIGVSNFNSEQLERLYETADIKPAMLQVEIHAYNQQEQLLETCRRLNVAVTAYSPLGSPSAQGHFLEKYDHNRVVADLLNEPVVLEIAKSVDKTPGQVLLKHLIQKNIIVIPKSVHPERIKQNISIFDFELSQENMHRLNTLDRGENGRIFDFMFFKGVESHPFYPFSKK